MLLFNKPSTEVTETKLKIEGRLTLFSTNKIKTSRKRKHPVLFSQNGPLASG